MSEDLLKAPCVFCGYNSSEYWQKHSHDSNCVWHSVGGMEDRKVLLPSAIKQLQQQLCENEARIARLEQSGNRLINALCDPNDNPKEYGDAFSDFDGVINYESPQQSLAEITAKAGREGFIYGVQFVEATALKNHDPIPLGARRRIAEEAADEYAQQLRDKADEPTA